MDMRGQHHRNFHVDLRHLERYRFAGQASEDGRVHGEPFESDEPDPIGDASAPATPALLGAAIGHCLSASLLEALRHAHIPVDDFQAEVNAVVAPEATGLPRIDHVEVILKPTIGQRHPRATRCEEVFERHCTVTSSVREGIDVRVRVDWQYSDEAQPAAPARSDEPDLAARL